MKEHSNVKAAIAYDDLREWLSLAERLGEVRNVSGASWQEDIGLAAEAVLRAENGPCVVFDDVPGCRKGFRVLLNMFAGTRRNMTLGFPDHLNKWELSEAYREFDAEERFHISGIHTEESPLCRAGDVLRGAIKPAECAAFGKECTPRHPLGATMVSSEGACAAYFNYGRFLSAEELATAGSGLTHG